MVVAKKDARQGGTAAPAPTPVEKAAAVVDISIPYDAAALLAYDQAGSKGDFETRSDDKVLPHGDFDAFRSCLSDDVSSDASALYWSTSLLYVVANPRATNIANSCRTKNRSGLISCL